MRMYRITDSSLVKTTSIKCVSSVHGIEESTVAKEISSVGSKIQLSGNGEI